VIGAQIGGDHALGSTALTVSALVMAALFSFHLSEIWTLRRFRRKWHDACWQPGDPPQTNAEVDDPILALLGRLHILRPTLRGRGGYEPPEEDCVEPARTERALARVFGCRFWRYCGGREERGGDVLETLPMWLDDANCRKGIYYVAVQTGLQLGIATLTGLLYANPWQLTEPGGKTVAILLVCSQAALVLWVLQHTSNDVFTQLDTLIGFTFELVATCLVLASNFLAGGGDEAIATSLQMAGVSADLLLWSAFVPMFFTAYDSFVVPVVLIFWKSELGFRETMCQVLISAILLPITVASSFFGFSAGTAGGAINSIVSEAEGSIVGLGADADAGMSKGGEELGPPTSQAAPSKNARKRLKRAEFLERVRGKATSVTPAHQRTECEASPRPSASVPQEPGGTPIISEIP